VTLDVHVVGAADLSDPENRFTQAYGISPSGAVVVRPDGFVGWRCADAANASAAALQQALETLLGRGRTRPAAALATQ
jgi:putative polyketide hydroxylase